LVGPLIPFATTMTRLAALPDSAMDGQWEWEGHEGWPLSGRDALYLSLLDELRGQAPSFEAAHLLAPAGGALGSLCGLLAGRPDDMLDRSPGGAEWSIRQILEHILLTERRYLAQTRYAATRSDDDPVRIELGIELDPGEMEGGIADLLGRLGAAHDESQPLFAISPGALDRPSVWAGYAVDVRFRLLRFGVHIAEHTIQCEKTLAALGETSGEARRIVRLIWAARGRHRAWTPVVRLEELDDVHAERSAGLGREY
jgi:hypothetical protein